ncbi:sensor histidine kinase [Blautia stercoris]|uniref:histidine kinase n=1 Tax=Blautia stercoris TaxID=871664 RepID=A0ABR7P955_9FIRM|nr:HAMP domain-containing sensor histidine kinase [Blautia stercoris]MBC8627376.1 HAMP domain-containing protein [Blautia stercoris]
MGNGIQVRGLGIKKSIKARLIVTFVGIVVIAFVLIALSNSFLLERYYVAKKTDAIQDVYEKLNQYDSLTGDKVQSLKSICIEKNISWVILDTNHSEILDYDSRNANRLYASLFGYITGVAPAKSSTLEETDNYTLEVNRDMDMDYLDMWGMLDNNNVFLIRLPMAGISDSIQISNMFYLYTGMIVVAISILAIWFLSQRLTKPLEELTDISIRMSNLDFNVKYESGGEDEIGVLGQNFNKMSKELEQTISELKTANNELQKDIEKKERIDDMRKEFLSNVSHELKTPIALIQGYAEGLKECINDEAESRDFYCEVIIDEAAKMNNMVKKLLTLNQLEFGNDQISMECFDLTELVRGVVNSAQLLADQKDAQILFVQDTSVYVWGDEFKIEEVVTNYVSNAINHIDGERKIEIKMQRREGHIRLSVFNTGKPIPEEDIDKIWIKFYKVDKARTREYGGSGIGLSIVKAIMESMNQKFGVKNYENGVEFWFELECR